MGRLVHRRIGEKLLFIVLLIALTYIPGLHVTDAVRSQLFGLFFAAALAALRSWAILLGKKALPPEQKHRREDRREDA